MLEFTATVVVAGHQMAFADGVIVRSGAMAGAHIERRALLPHGVVDGLALAGAARAIEPLVKETLQHSLGRGTAAPLICAWVKSVV